MSLSNMILSSPSLTTVARHSTDVINVTMLSSLPHMGTTSSSPMETNAESGCLVQEQKYNPQNNPENIINAQTLLWITTTTSSVIIPVLFLVGVPGNLLSAAVFYKHGLRERINLCIFSLALVDFIVIGNKFFILAEEAYRRFFGSSNFFIKYFMSLAGFNWVSMFLSAVIAAERCFCVVSPLRAQRMLSTRTLAVIITPISLILLTGMLVIAGPKHTEACVFDPNTNSTTYIVYVTEYYIENKEILDIVDIFVYATALPVMFFVVIVVTTIITAFKLRSASRWRQQSSSGSGVQPGGTLDSQMVALTRMLVVTSVLFLVCMIPIPVMQMTMFWVRELKFGGRYHNVTILIWNTINTLQGANSSLNCFIYYKMGSRFRQTLKQLLHCKRVKMDRSGSDYVDSSSNISHNNTQRDFLQCGKVDTALQ